jgi:hypothetical protein
VKKFSDHDSDSLVLSDIRELLYIHVAADSGFQHDAWIKEFENRRMEDEE